MEDDEGAPAWMVCDAIVSKLRDETLSQAVSVMHEQLEKKRLSLEGQLPTLNEGEGEHDRDAFLLKQILNEHANIERQFMQYMQQAKLDKDSLSRVDELQKFLLELRQIVLLSEYSKECESWMADVEKELKDDNPARILAKTLEKDSGRRREVLDYALKNKKFASDGIFSAAERKIMEDAIGLSHA